MSNPALIFRGLTPLDDWSFGNGLSDYATGSAAVALNIKTALRTFFGDAFWQSDFGIDWLNLLGNRNTENAILAQTRSTIAGCEGVTKIISVDSRLDANARTLFLTYRYADIYSSAAILGATNIGI